MDNLKIDSFRGQWQFLSNFHWCDVDVTFVFAPRLRWTMPTVEHAFQAIKVVDSRLTDEEKMLYVWKVSLAGDPTAAKKMGRELDINVKSWDAKSTQVMARLIQQKFEQNPNLVQPLLATGETELIEGNSWGDFIWGQVDGVGENRLGQILMAVRSQLRAREDGVDLTVTNVVE